MNILPSSKTNYVNRMIAIEQEQYEKKWVDSSFDGATTNSAIDFSLTVTGLLFISQIYKSQQQVWNQYSSLFKTIYVNRMIVIEQEYYGEKLVGNIID